MREERWVEDKKNVVNIFSNRKKPMQRGDLFDVTTVSLFRVLFDIDRWRDGGE